jgi:hypothetical protein
MEAEWRARLVRMGSTCFKTQKCEIHQGPLPNQRDTGLGKPCDRASRRNSPADFSPLKLNVDFWPPERSKNKFALF